MPYKDPEIAKFKTAEYREKNREAIRERARKRYAENPYPRRNSNNRSLIRQRYKIEPEEKERLLLDQGSVCAICETDTPPTKTGWHLDHCHASGKIRVILCQHCNNMLGMAKDDIEILFRAIDYLEDNK